VIVPIAGALFIILLVFYVLFTATKVQGDSMLPNLRTEDRVLITRGYDAPARSDVVVVDAATGSGATESLVKRVVGISGDVVEVRDDIVYVNGEPEAGYEIARLPGAGMTLAPYEVPAGTVYVMGDNRPISADSRMLGALPLSAVQGRVVAIFAPVNRVGPVPSGAALTASAAGD
jgi:signal peptidase I